MRRSVPFLVVLAIVASGPRIGWAQSFDLGHLGFGVLGGGPGLGIGSTSTDTGTTTPAGAAFGTKAEAPGQLTGIFDGLTGSLTGPDLVKMPSRLVPEDIPVGHKEEITPGH
jgi:hypothetical protein